MYTKRRPYSSSTAPTADRMLTYPGICAENAIIRAGFACKMHAWASGVNRVVSELNETSVYTYDAFTIDTPTPYMLPACD